MIETAKVMRLRPVVHKKTGKIYWRLEAEVKECTNGREDIPMAVYMNGDGMVFTRELDEFLQKFEDTPAFDPRRIISCLDPDEASVGKRYWFSDTVTGLRRQVWDGVEPGVLAGMPDRFSLECFIDGNGDSWELVYPAEGAGE